MAGHISYPRTAAVANAWSNYRHAISLANGGAIDASISALRAILHDPNAPAHLKQLAAELVSKLYAQSEPRGVELSHVLQPDFKTDHAGTTRLTGLHHIEGNQNLEKGRVADLLDGPNEHGVYEAVVEARNPSDNLVYQKFSTMFPDDYTKDEVVACIENARRFGRIDSSGHIIGPSGRGFDVNIRGKTAYPRFTSNNSR